MFSFPLPWACRARRSVPVTSLALAALLAFAPLSFAQDTSAPQTPAATTPGAQNTQTPAAEEGAPVQKKHHWIQKDEPENAGTSRESSTPKPAKTSGKPEKKSKLHIAKDERVVATKDTRAELRREKKYNPLVGKDADLPDKQLYDKALTEENKGHYDVARLDLQTLLNTYPDSQYLMRAKLAVANSWFKEGGSASMAQAEQEYSDFITFFPNAPEAAEAQMRMGDIYLKQMDVPDRDYSKAMKAEEQYRLMLKTYPDAPASVTKEAAQKLRDVQEVLAQREFELGQFYALRGNYSAAIARYKTVADTYPLFSHMDDVLIGLGDAYEAEATAIRTQPTCAGKEAAGCFTEAVKARLLQDFDGRAAGYYRDVVLNHAAAPHVEDAKERLQTMGLPLPTPTAQQIAASEALEGSRAQYTMRKRLELLFVREPDTVNAAQMGVPPLQDATPTTAPAVSNQIRDDFRMAVNPAAAREVAAKAPEGPSPDTGGAETPASPAAGAGTGAAPTLSDVPTAGNAVGEDTTGTVTEVSPGETTPAGGASVGNRGASLGAEIVTPGASTGSVPTGSMTGAPVSDRASDLPAATGKADPNYGLAAPKTSVAPPLPAAEAPAAAPDAINEAAGKAEPPAQGKTGKKTPKPTFDKNDESSSKHKKKKGVDKLNPF